MFSCKVDRRRTADIYEFSDGSETAADTSESEDESYLPDPPARGGSAPKMDVVGEFASYEDENVAMNTVREVLDTSRMDLRGKSLTDDNIDVEQPEIMPEMDRNAVLSSKSGRKANHSTQIESEEDPELLMEANLHLPLEILLFNLSFVTDVKAGFTGGKRPKLGSPTKRKTADTKKPITVCEFAEERFAALLAGCSANKKGKNSGKTNSIRFLEFHEYEVESFRRRIWA